MESAVREAWSLLGRIADREGFPALDGGSRKHGWGSAVARAAGIDRGLITRWEIAVENDGPWPDVKSATLAKLRQVATGSAAPTTRPGDALRAYSDPASALREILLAQGVSADPDVAAVCAEIDDAASGPTQLARVVARLWRAAHPPIAASDLARAAREVEHARSRRPAPRRR